MRPKITLHRLVTFAGLVVCLSAAACRESPTPAPPAAPAARHVVLLNQGWSEREARFYDHANEGTNLAPVDFFLNLPDPAKPGSKFVGKISTDYGFIPSEKSAANPHGLPLASRSTTDRPASAIAPTSG